MWLVVKMSFNIDIKMFLLATAMFCLAHSSRRICDLDSATSNEKYSNSFPHRSSESWNECREYVVEESTVYTRIQCLEACFRNQQCQSFNYGNRAPGADKIRCVLLNAPTTKMFKDSLCMIPSNAHSSEQFTPGTQEDKTKSFKSVRFMSSCYLY